MWRSRASDSHTSHLTAGAPSAPLRAGRDGINPTFTWARLAQRIPVTVHLTHVPPGVVVSAGMTCTVMVKDGMQPRIGASMKYLISHSPDDGLISPTLASIQI